MWESIKNLIIGAKDALGIELPELPVDLGAAGEELTGNVLTGDLAGASETAAGLPAAQSAGQSAAQSAESAGASAAESAAQVLPDLTNVLPEAGRR